MLITTSADVLSRACYNALRYCPKAGKFAMCMIVPTPEGVSIVTSDSYALSWAIFPGELPETVVHYAAIKLSYESLTQLEERSRKGKKEGVQLSFEPGNFLEYRGEDGGNDMQWTDVFADSMFDEETSWDERVLQEFREIIMERLEDPESRRVVLAPKYVQKLGQLKKEDPNVGADFLFGGEDDDVLIRVGQFFRVAIHPIVPVRHRAALGEEALWPLTAPSALTG